MREFATIKSDPPALIGPSWTEIDDWFAYVIGKMHELGVAVPNQSRIPSQRRLVAEFGKDPRLFGPLRSHIPDVVAALTDIMQLRIALKFSATESERNLYLEKLTLCVNDSPSIKVDSAFPTPGRDAQFELFSRGCVKAKLQPRLRNPPGPDLCVGMSCSQFTLEMKRIRTKKALLHKARKASSQIERTEHPGVFASDLTLLFANDTPISESSIDRAGEEVKNRLQGFCNEHIEKVRAKVNYERVVCWSLFAAQLAFVEGNYCGTFMLWLHTNLCDENNDNWPNAGEIFAEPKEYFLT